MKKDRIYKQIKQNIISGNLKEGDKLPTEFECMELYGVSRDTVRNAFKMLEAEGFIKRVKSKGTFIQLPEISPEKKTIHFLVPCYEYLHCSSDHFMHVMFDLIAECALAGWNLVPVIFSQTNNNKDIWWENLARFNADSKIVVMHYWFSTYFKTLSAINAKVAFINNGAKLSPELANHSAQWTQFIENDCHAGENAVKYLAQKKCRKIGLLMENIMDPNNTLLVGFKDTAQKLQLQECVAGTSVETTIEEMRDFYKAEKFDGLILHIDEYKLPRKSTLHESLGLPENMPIVAIPYKTSIFYNDLNEDIAVVNYPIRQMAHDIVQYLISPHKKIKKFRYIPEISVK